MISPMSPKRVFLASDHAGFPIKDLCAQKLKELEIEVIDLGPQSADRVDYPDFADEVCQKVISEKAFGLLVCGSGQGMAMRANKYSQIRAALCWTPESAELSRQHNDANVLCVGARLLEKQTILNILETFFKTDFEGGRHENRVRKISKPV